MAKSILIISCLLSLGACNMASLAGNSLKTEAVAANKTLASPPPAAKSAADESAATSPTAVGAAPDQPVPLLTAANENENNVIITPADQTDASADLAVAAGSASDPAEILVGSLAAGDQEIIEAGLIDQNSCTRGLPGQLITGLAGQNLIVAAASADSGAPLFMDMALRTESPATEAAPVAGTAGPPQKTAAVSDDQAKSAGKTAGNLSLKAGVTENLLVAAYEQTGRPFKSGGQAPGTGFDAAGYTYWVFHEKGISLPQGAKRQAASGRQVAKDELRPGDILVYRDPSLNDGNGGYHVGIYTGQGNFLHAAPKTGVVTETAAFGPQFSPYFVGGRRYFDDPKARPLSDEQKMAAASSAVKLALSELGPNDKLVKNIKKPTAKKSKKTKKK
ncbi:C40 family peptidase [Deltaproteobacteria bacterium OttesenSCG-928-M10]|nr:C40 family peptidase [Deltaproteobacteria bacterium OttesenSCG-928-M10]